MKLLDLTWPSPEENLACDEALLDACEEGGGEEILRFWEPREIFVVVGYANSVTVEVNLPACDADRVRVLRRCTGGGTVLQGPGCLNYSLVLRTEASGPLATISGANRFVMDRNRRALASVAGRPVVVRGHTDLAIGDLKFSGNAQRRLRRCLLFHGCFLLNLETASVERYLRMPSREPAYRRHRSHTAFLTNLVAEASVVRAALQQEWGATEPLTNAPLDAVQLLARKKYAIREWNLRL